MGPGGGDEFMTSGMRRPAIVSIAGLTGAGAIFYITDPRVSYDCTCVTTPAAVRAAKRVACLFDCGTT